MDFSCVSDIMQYCMTKGCAYESRPFGPDPICYRVAGKIFAQLSPKEDWFKVTVKTSLWTICGYARIYLHEQKTIKLWFFFEGRDMSRTGHCWE